MRAVNLIPTDQRRGAGGVAGRAGGVAYVVVGGLVVLVVMAVLYAVATKQVSNRKTQVATVSAQATAAEAQANTLQPFVQFATISQQRKQAVATLANARFNWSGAMDQIARALPADVTLSSLNGTSSGAAGAAAAAAAASATPVGPSFDFNGCASSHPGVAAALVSLRKIEGVVAVTLSTSQKAAQAAGTTSTTAPASSGGGAGGCPRVSFHGVVTYAASYTVGAPSPLAGSAPIPAVAGAAQPATQPVATASAPAASGAQQPSAAATTAVKR